MTYTWECCCVWLMWLIADLRSIWYNQDERWSVMLAIVPHWRKGNSQSKGASRHKKVCHTAVRPIFSSHGNGNFFFGIKSCLSAAFPKRTFISSVFQMILYLLINKTLTQSWEETSGEAFPSNIKSVNVSMPIDSEIFIKLIIKYELRNKYLKWWLFIEWKMFQEIKKEQSWRRKKTFMFVVRKEKIAYKTIA